MTLERQTGVRPSKPRQEIKATTVKRVNTLRAVREGGRMNRSPIDISDNLGMNMDLKCSKCGKQYKRKIWLEKHVKEKHSDSEAGQKAPVSSPPDTIDRVQPHTSQSVAQPSSHHEAFSPRDRLSLPSISETTWKQHDRCLAERLDLPGCRQSPEDQLYDFQGTIYNYFSELYPVRYHHNPMERENTFKAKLRRRKRELIKQLRKAKASGDRNLCHQLARAMRSILKLIQKVSEQITVAGNEFRKAQNIAAFEKNPFYFAKKAFKEQQGTIRLSTDEMFNYFKSTYTTPEADITYRDPPAPKPKEPALAFDADSPTMEELEYHIKRKPNSSAPGPDGIPYIIYKKCPSVRKHMLNIYKRIWTNREVPDCLGKAVFVLLPKKKEVTDPKDIRPIALTNTISKIFFSIIQARLLKHMCTNDYLPKKYQKGFLPRVAGCLEHNSLLTECLRDARKNERQLTATWLDFENAFGSVRHELLLKALEWYNVPPLICNIIASYYKKLSFVIQVKGET